MKNNKMKKSLSFAMALVMLLGVMPMSAFAENVDYQQGTQVSYNAEDPDGDGIANNKESYMITVPALLAPGDSGTVTLTGTWASNRTVNVTASETVEMVNSINENDTKELDVTFAGISKDGSNIETVTATAPVSVEEITNALFGTWEGMIYYNVDIVTNGAVLEGDGQTFHKMAPTALTFRSTAPLDEFQEVKINGEVVDPSNYTLKEGSTIVTLSADYLQTLDAENYEITVVSETVAPSAGFEVIEPELNDHGFYYNQPYTAYVDRFGGNTAFFVREDGTFDAIVNDENWGAFIERGTYTVSENNLTLDCDVGTFTTTVSSNGMEIYCNELEINFVLGDESIVADEDYIYVYDTSLSGYVVSCIDNTKSEYVPVKTGINGKPTVKLDGFGNNPNLIAIPKIPDSVTIIGGYAFGDCDSLKTLEIPASIISIEASAFMDCDSLEIVTFEENSRLETIGGSCFAASSPDSLSTLTTIYIPASVKSIEHGAFYKCVALTNIIFEGTVEQWKIIDIAEYWGAEDSPVTEVICSDGTVSLIP